MLFQGQRGFDQVQEATDQLETFVIYYILISFYGSCLWYCVFLTCSCLSLSLII
jgi:hypothetical protein